MGTESIITDWTSHHHEYFLIASHSLASAMELETEVKNKDDDIAAADAIAAENSGRPDARDEDIRTIITPQIIQLLEKQSLYIIESVLFSALCTEAFINYYAIRRKSAKFLKYLDKLTPEQKWYLVPQLIVGRSFELGREPLQGLSELIKLRNSLVHAKASIRRMGDPFKLPEGRFGGPSLKQCKKGVTTVRALVKGLAAIDPVIDTTWLDSTRPEVLFTNLEKNGKWVSGL